MLAFIYSGQEVSPYRLKVTDILPTYQILSGPGFLRECRDPRVSGLEICFSGVSFDILCLGTRGNKPLVSYRMEMNGNRMIVLLISGRDRILSELHSRIINLLFTYIYI